MDIRIFISIALLIAAFAPRALASTRALAPYCEELLSPANDTSVELEIATSPAVMALITTVDGKVRGLLGDIPAPNWYETWAKANHPELADPLDLEWDALDVAFQRALIAHRSHGQSFFESRTIHGLVLKPAVTVNFPEPMELFGASFPAGPHELRTGAFMANYVEFRSPQDVSDAAGVELHFRAGLPAGTFSKDVSTFLRLLGASGDKRQHVHLPFWFMPKDLDPMVREQAIEYLHRLAFGAGYKGDINAFIEGFDVYVGALIQVEFHRRVNMLAELAELMVPGGLGRISAARSVLLDYSWNDEGVLVGNTSKLWAPLSDDELGVLMGYTLELLGGHEIASYPGDRMAWVSFRGRGFYDDRQLAGNEFRAVDHRMGDGFYERFLNSVQQRRQTGKFGLRQSTLMRWSSEVSYWATTTDSPVLDSVIKSLWVRSAATGPDVPAFLRQAPGFDAKRLLALRNKNHLELDYLLHDWSRDPLFFSDAAAVKRIRELQLRAIGQLKTELDILPVMQAFFKNSKIWETLESSILIDKGVSWLR